jgi:hypothetical protein
VTSIKSLDKEWVKFNWTLYYLCIGASIREAARKAHASRRYAENVNKKIILPLRTILTSSEIRSVAQELLEKEDISSLLEKLFEKASERTDELWWETIFEAILLLLDKEWVTPEIILMFLSYIKGLSLQSIKILPELLDNPYILDVLTRFCRKLQYKMA